MQFSRFISVLISGTALLLVVLLGFSGCGDSKLPFDETTAVYSKVSGEKAFSHVEALVGFGSRYAGSEQLEKSRVYLIEQLDKNGWAVTKQSFQRLTPDGNVQFVNLRARFKTDGKEKPATGIICSHYDTKKFSYEFVGANDGGSSTGLLVEISRVLAQRPKLAKQIELVFFDGEEAFGPKITTSDGLYGSKYYSRKMVLTPVKKRPKWGLLLDMVGDKDLNVRAAIQIPNASIRDLKKAKEDGHTVDFEVVKKSVETMSKQLLSAAKDLGVRSQIGISTAYITDDHIPLNTGAGIPTIDIIDFDYGNYWHTPADTLDKLSPKSLETVGKVTLLLVEKYLVN